MTSSVAFSFATFLNFANYKGYWNGTIFAVQTVDFNILSHTLPTKLSYAIQHKDIDEIQNTLNSNFGLFGIVVTDCKTQQKECPNQNLLYYSKSNRNWKKQLNIKDLSQHSYDLLRTPIPLKTENKYSGTRAIVRIKTGKNNSGKIIGRVYYIRSLPPTFKEDYWRWLKNPLSTSGAHKYYSLTTSMFLFGGLAFLSILEFVLYSRRKNQEHLTQQVRLLQYQLDGEQRHNIMLQSEIQELNADLENNNNELRLKNEEHFLLETYIQDLQTQSQLHQDEITLLQTQFEKAKLQTESYDSAIAKLEREITDRQQREIEADLIHQMQQELTQLHEQREKNYQNFNLLQNKIEELRIQKKLDEEIIANLEFQLSNVQEEKETYTKSYDELQKKISELEVQKIKADNLMNQFQHELEVINTQNQSQIDANDSLSQNITRLEEELNQERQARQIEEQLTRRLKKQLQEYTHQEEEDNFFEKKIKQYIINHVTPLFPDCIILSSFDVASGVQASRVVDIILIINSFCVVTIEAKNYKGKINVNGIPRNNKWYCNLNERRKIMIQSASFTNPYRQVLKYSQSISQRLNDYNSNHPKVNVYGLIVFPQNADISQIQNMLGSYYNVVNINSLKTVLQELEKNQQNIKSQYQPLSTQEIENILRGQVIPKYPLLKV